MALFGAAPPPAPPPTLLDSLLALAPRYRQAGCGTSAYPFLAATILFTLLMEAWERYLDWRQHRRLLGKPATPESTRGGTGWLTSP